MAVLRCLEQSGTLPKQLLVWCQPSPDFLGDHEGLACTPCQKSLLIVLCLNRTDVFITVYTYFRW